jgi:4-amino-4-deoxy-L-arabinose transferase-like glycosyltransferase
MSALPVLTERDPEPGVRPASGGSGPEGSTGWASRALRAWSRVEFWVISRVAVIGSLLLLATMVKVTDQPWDASSGWAAHRFAAFDSGQFLRIAESGYFPGPVRCCSQAFFPGYPLLMRAVAPLVGGHEIWAGMLITLVAGVIAAALLWRLAAEHGGPAAGQLAVAALALNPMSLFMAVVYSEALFLALALAAWLLARRGRWWWAGLAMAGTTAVRVNGLFLVAALGVMFLIQLYRRRPGVHWYDGAALALPAVPIAAYFAWLHAQTGSWTAWNDAEKLGWDRHLATPWTGLAQGWSDAFHGGISIPATADLVAVLIGVAVTVALIVLRRWPEATYMGLNMVVLVCSTTLTSSARYTLTWIPMYILLAEILARPGRRWLQRLLATAAIPLLVFFTGAWTMRWFIG